MSTITITKLPSPEHSGDWHDKPLNWLASGPDKEAQKFSTKKDALHYARIRHACGTQAEAISAFAKS